MTGTDERAPSVLVDENASKQGDLYIRSVCFSPDGKYLATGAEDKQIRVGALVSPCRSSANGAIDLGHRQEAHPEHL